jgi:hypothetical protein
VNALRAAVRLRPITEQDLPAIARLLCEGFANRSEAYWLRGLMRHARRPPPDGYPTFGFCLDSDGDPVGAILLLFSQVLSATGECTVRCNVSSWYVRPEFRSFGSLLVTSTTRDKAVTYFNITPAPHTWVTVEAQRFSVYCKGQIYGVLPLRAAVAGARAELFTDATTGLSPFEHDMLRQHAIYGCVSVVIKHGDDVLPFVFQKHRVKGIVPVWRLLYCRSTDDLVRYAGNLGWLLARHGSPLVRWDANEPARGIVGWYSEKRGRKYAKGPHPPRLGDLAFTEAALFDS